MAADVKAAAASNPNRGSEQPHPAHLCQHRGANNATAQCNILAANRHKAHSKSSNLLKGLIMACWGANCASCDSHCSADATSGSRVTGCQEERQAQHIHQGTHATAQLVSASPAATIPLDVQTRLMHVSGDETPQNSAHGFGRAHLMVCSSDMLSLSITLRNRGGAERAGGRYASGDAAATAAVDRSDIDIGLDGDGHVSIVVGSADGRGSGARVTADYNPIVTLTWPEICLASPSKPSSGGSSPYWGPRPSRNTQCQQPAHHVKDPLLLLSYGGRSNACVGADAMVPSAAQAGSCNPDVAPNTAPAAAGDGVLDGAAVVVDSGSCSSWLHYLGATAATRAVSSGRLMFSQLPPLLWLNRSDANGQPVSILPSVGSVYAASASGHATSSGGNLLFNRHLDMIVDMLAQRERPVRWVDAEEWLSW